MARTPEEDTVTHPRSRWEEIVEANPDHSTWYVECFRAMARDDDHKRRVQTAPRRQRMRQQRRAPQPVQHLGQLGLHPAALPRRQHDQRHRPFRHPRLPFVDLSASCS